jgi:hypothetical protein
MKIHQHHRHPRAGGDPARGEAAIYKCRVAADQTPAFAGVTDKEERI